MISGTIINVSYPRSGHRFLREILLNYFGDDFVFYESYSKTLLSGSNRPLAIKDVNYVKTHDFALEGEKVLTPDFAEGRRYLLQIRHPIESIASFYEFALKHNHVKKDSEKNWHLFLEDKLTYWKSFCDSWILNPPADSILVPYSEL